MPYTPSGIGSTNTPTLVGNQATTYNFLGSVGVQQLSLLYPDVAPYLVPRYGKQKIGLIKILEKIGLTQSVGESSIIRHWEEDFIHGRIPLATTGGGAAGVAHTVDIAAAGVFDEDQTAPYVGTNTNEKITPILNDIVQFSNGVEAVVTAVNVAGPDFTCVPVDPADSIPAVQNGDFCIIKGSTVREGSTARQSKNSRVIYYENYMMRHRNDIKVTGTAGGEKIWFTVPKRDGAPGTENVWTTKAYLDGIDRHKNELDMLVLDGKAITNPALTAIAGFETVTKTEGLIQTVESAGNVSNYTINNMSLTDIEDLIDSFLRFKAPKDQLVFCGFGFYKNFNSLVREGDGMDLFASGGPGRIIFREFSGGNQEIDLDINKFSYLGFNFYTEALDLFADVQTLGSVDKYPALGLFCPIGNAVRYLDENPESSATVPTLELVSKRDQNGQSRYHVETYTGMQVGNTDEDAWNAHVVSEFALRVAAVNRFGVMLGQAS